MKKLVALLVAGSIVMGGAVIAKTNKHLLRKDDKKHPTQKYDVTQGFKNVGNDPFASQGNCKRNWAKKKAAKDYANPSAPKGLKLPEDSELSNYSKTDAKCKRNWKKTKAAKDYAKPSVPRGLKNPEDRDIDSNCK